MRGYTEQSAAKVKEIEFIGRELEGVRDLFSKNLIPISRVTALERDAARLEGERGQLVATIAQGKGKISETELQIIQVDQTMRSDVAKELADIRAKISELTERRVTAADQLQRIDIRAPQTGIVHQLSFFTTGGVVAAGEQIMLIVPQADDLTVEVRVDPQKIDQLQLGQAATLRFPGFNQRTTPELNGRVTRIAADVIQDQRTGQPYYLVRIGLATDEIERLNGLKLVPGMPVEAFISTGERTMLSVSAQAADRPGAPRVPGEVEAQRNPGRCRDPPLSPSATRAPLQLREAPPRRRHNSTSPTRWVRSAARNSLAAILTLP